MATTESSSPPLTSTGSSPLVDNDGETSLEHIMDIALGIAFLLTAFLAARRMSSSPAAGAAGSSGAETTVVTAFYSLILWTSILRAVWFVIQGDGATIKRLPLINLLASEFGVWWELSFNIVGDF